jgi:carboxyvinyl-carboxyphosphonate phosphorylmutase
MTNAKKLREIFLRETTVLVPGAYDAFSAKILKQAGFEVIYMTGSGVTASVIGMPDVGLLTMSEMVNQARHIVNATDLPVICDADTGYGNALNVIRTVKEYERAGVAGIHMEDQVAPQKCGHFEGKQVIAAEEMVKKIEAALYAREDENFLLIARTDARSIMGLDEALRRAHLYVAAGADMIFLESTQTFEEFDLIAKLLQVVPLLVNLVDGGKTPVLPFEELEKMGFKIVLYPTSTIRAVAKTVQDIATYLFAHKNPKGVEQLLIPFEEKNQITGLSEIVALENKFSL